MEDKDNDLTSLAWLLSSNVMPNVAESSVPLTSRSLPEAAASATTSTPPEKKIKLGGNLSSSPSTSTSKSKSNRKSNLSNSISNKKKLLVHQKTNANTLAEYHNRMLKEIDYRNDAEAKPPYSYAALICLAMKDTKKKMTLSQIYKWIRDSFAYYRKADKSWQNSIRHNLSLNKCFKKINRTKEEPGKGGFWMLDPKYLQDSAEPSNAAAADTDDDELQGDPTDLIKREFTSVWGPSISPIDSVSQDLREDQECKKKDSNAAQLSNATKICLKFQLSNQPSTSGPMSRKQPLKSPLMPTSCTTFTGSSQIVNLTYNVPSDNPNFVISRNGNKVPISFSSLNPLPPSSTSSNNSLIRNHPDFSNIPPRISDLISSPSPASFDYNNSRATPPTLLSLNPPPLDQHQIEEEFYHEDPLNSNSLEMALYSPLPHLQFANGHASSVTGLGITTPLEDWIKHPTNLPLSSDTLMASFHPESSPATPNSILNDTPLPPFSQASSALGLVSAPGGFTLPPLESTLDFESVDLESIPP